MLSVERYATCWKSICRKELSPVRCFAKYLNCDTLDDGDRQKWINGTSVFSSCTPGDSTIFNYGIFENAVTNNVVSSEFIEKYFYCLWWGLQNLRYNLQKCYIICMDNWFMIDFLIIDTILVKGQAGLRCYQFIYLFIFHSRCLLSAF